MPAPDDEYDWAQHLLSTYRSESERICDLVKAAGLNPFDKDMANVDLSNLDLTGEDFSGWNLEFANFGNSDIARARFTGARLRTESFLNSINWRLATFDAAFASQLEKTIPTRASTSPIIRAFFPVHLAPKIIGKLANNRRLHPSIPPEILDALSRYIDDAITALEAGGEPALIDAFSRALMFCNAREYKRIRATYNFPAISAVDAIASSPYKSAYSTAKRIISEELYASTTWDTPVRKTAPAKKAAPVKKAAAARMAAPARTAAPAKKLYQMIDEKTAKRNYAEIQRHTNIRFLAEILSTISSDIPTLQPDLFDSFSILNRRMHSESKITPDAKLFELSIPIERSTLVRLSSFTIGRQEFALGVEETLLLLGCIMGTRWLSLPLLE